MGSHSLALTRRLPADVLVVEGWIGREGIRAAVAEFEHHGYHYIVATGGLTSGRWENKPESYAKMAAAEMIRLGVPNERIIVATPEYTERCRTFESAVCRLVGPSGCGYPVEDRKCIYVWCSC